MRNIRNEASRDPSKRKCASYNTLIMHFHFLLGQRLSYSHTGYNAGSITSSSTSSCNSADTFFRNRHWQHSFVALCHRIFTVTVDSPKGMRNRCIVPVFYCKHTRAVNDSDDVSLQIMNIAILHAVILYKCRSRLGIIEKMQRFHALSAAFIHGSSGRMGNQLTAESRTAKYSFVESMPFTRGCLPRA